VEVQKLLNSTPWWSLAATMLVVESGLAVAGIICVRGICDILLAQPRKEINALLRPSALVVDIAYKNVCIDITDKDVRIKESRTKYVAAAVPL
jgi:hypothetical protein